MTSVETSKNTVVIETNRVVKTFKAVPRAARRFRCEVESLRRLAGMADVPALLAVSEPQLRLVVSRLPGRPLSETGGAPDAAFHRLRSLVAEMMLRGVARHSLPPRDVLIGPQGQLGLVDFERVTLRGSAWSPVWLVACGITRYHLLRLIGDHAPQLLTVKEARRLGIQRRLGNFYHSFLVLRRRILGLGAGNKDTSR